MASLDRSNGDAKSFAIRRFFRIYPLAAFCILAVPVFRIPVGPGMIYHWMGAKEFFANLALAQNLFYAPSVLGPLWSLPLEVQMYCFLPGLYVAARRDFRWALGIWGFGLLCALTLPRISGRVDMFSYAPCFASGILAYSLARMIVPRKLPGAVWIITILGSILLFNPFNDIPLTSKLPLAWGLSLVIGVALSVSRELTSRPLHRVTHLIAKYSYGIYLTHIVVLWFVMDVMRGYPVIFRIAVFLAGLVGLPVLLFHAVENPMIRVGRSLSTTRKTPSDASLTGSSKPLPQVV